MKTPYDHREHAGRASAELGRSAESALAHRSAPWRARPRPLAELEEFLGALDAVQSCALRVSSNNQFLASGSDKSLRIWDLKDAAYSFDTFGERVRALSYRDVNPASRGNAKPKFASSDGNGIQLWQPSGVIGAHILSPWSSHVGGGFSDSTAEARVVAEENGLMATGWTNGVVEIRDENGYGAVRLVAHASGVESVTFSLGATNLASGGRDGTVKLWPARKLMDKANLEASQTRKKKER